jgi:hypothetical protein
MNPIKNIGVNQNCNEISDVRNFNDSENIKNSARPIMNKMINIEVKI